MKQEALNKLMKEDMEANVSAYIGRMITQEVLRRDNKKPVGRPKKEDEKEEYYPCPYNPDSFPYTKSELIGYYQFRQEEVPEGVKPLTKKELEKWPELPV
jgi:hypothetical protein